MEQAVRVVVADRSDVVTPTAFVTSPKFRWIGVLGIAVCLALAAYHWLFVIESAVDVPRADEWHYFDQTGRCFEPIPSWEWLISSNGSHRILFTRLMMWVHYFLDGMNFAHVQVANFGLFFVGVLFLVVLKRVTLGRDRFALFPFFLLFLLSPIAYENHIWPYQSQVHFLLLFTLAGAYFGFKPKRRAIDDLWFALACISAAYSFSCGVGVAAAYVLIFCLQRIQDLLSGRRNWLALLRAAMVTAAVGYSLNRWLEGFVTLKTVDLLDPLFGRFLLNLISLGHGFETSTSVIPGDVIMLMLAVPSIVLLLKSDSRRDATVWLRGAIGWATVAALATIAFGRAGNYAGDYTGAKFSR
jgi:hypothetical protein